MSGASGFVRRRPSRRARPPRANSFFRIAVGPARNTCYKCHASSSRCLTSSNKKLVETSATLVVTGSGAEKDLKGSEAYSEATEIRSN